MVIYALVIMYLSILFLSGDKTLIEKQLEETKKEDFVSNFCTVQKDKFISYSDASIDAFQALIDQDFFNMVEDSSKCFEIPGHFTYDYDPYS